MNPFNFKSFLGETSVLEVERFVQWKKENGAYNFNKLPKTAILSLFTSQPTWLNKMARRKLKGLNGDNYLIKNSNYMLCEGHRSGGPEIVNLCEELRALGVEQFIFVGLAGSINAEIEEGNLFYVSETWSGSGLSYYYDGNENVIPKHKALSKLLNNSRIINCSEVSVWSTDAPFRETKSLIEYYEQKGAKLVEMECASIYAFANFYNLKAACYVISSDQLLTKWTPPKNIQKIKQKGQETIQNIIKIIENND